MLMPVDLLPNRSPSPSTAAWLEELVDEIVTAEEDRVLEQDIAHWREDLRQRLEQVHSHPEQGLGFIEEHIRQATLRLQRLLVQKAMQDQANQVEEKCPDCGRPLRDKKRRVVRWIEAYCGKVKRVASVSVCGRKSADGGSFFQSAGSGVAPQRVRAGLSTAFKAFYQGFEGLSVVPGEPRGGVLGDRRGVLLQGHEVVEGVGAVELRGMDQAHLDVAHPGSHQRFIGQ